MYHRHRFPAEIISYCVWLYFRCSLSFRDVEEMMAKRGVVLTYETLREWCLKLGGIYAKRMRSCSPRPSDRWHLDEAFLKIQGKLQYLWRAVDQDGEVLDILVQPRRNKRAAKKFFRKLLKGLHSMSRGSLSPTNWAATLRRRKYYCPASSIAGIEGLTTGRRTPTSPPANGSDACEASRVPGMRNAFCRCLG